MMEASEVIMLLAIVVLTLYQCYMVMRVSRHLDLIEELILQCTVEVIVEDQEVAIHD